MRCLFVYKEEYPWDVRVEKIIKSLVGAGNEVLLVCRNLRQEPAREIIDGFTVRRLPALKSWPGVIRKLSNLALWFNPFWLITTLRAEKEFQPQVIIVRDLPLVMTGIIVGRYRNVPVVFDMAECYPEMYRSSRQFRKGFSLWAWMKSPWLAGLYERIAIRLVDHIFVMIEESRDRLIRMNLPPEKTTIVSNTPSLSRVPQEPREVSGGELRIVYVGFLTRIRGLDVLIRGVRKFLDSFGSDASIRVDIVGKGAARDELVSLVDELGLTDHIRVHGWLDHSEVEEILRSANVGALTYRICSHWNHTIPNKLFDYMAMGLPVLATGVEPVKRILGVTHCGVVCENQVVNDIAIRLGELRDPQVRREFGRNGRLAVLEHFNWEKDEERMLAALEKLSA